MYIEDRLFSETSDEVLYSITMTEDEYDLFSEFQENLFSKKKKNRGPRLRNIDSNRGMGRAIIVGGPVGAGGALIGGYLGKRKAEELDESGASDSEIIRGSANHAAKIGAAAGALQGLGFGAARRNPAAALGSAASGAVLGSFGAYLGARKNAQDKISKRNNIRADYDD